MVHPESEKKMDDSWKEVSKEKLLEEMEFQGEIIKELSRRNTKIILLINNIFKDLEKFRNADITKLIEKYRKKLLEE